MKKVLILVLALSFISASCTLFGGSGSRGVFKSQDNGETYVAVNAMDPEGSIGGLTTNVLVMDRSNTEVLYMGSSSGIHKTENGGGVWKHMLAGMRIGDISIDPADSNVIFAAGVIGDNGKILKSSDAGVTWSDVYTEPTKGNPVLSIAISSANSSIVIAGLNNGEVIRTTDSGISWQGVKDTGNAVTDIEFINSGAAYLLANNNGLYYTSDHGATWAAVPAVLASTPSASFATGITFQQAASSNAYNDMAFDPRNPANIYLGSEKGIMKSSDSGATWQLLSLPVSNQSLPVTAVSIHPAESDTVYVAIGSTIFKTTNGGSTWETRKLGSEQRVRFIIVDPQEVNNIYLGMGEAS